MIIRAPRLTEDLAQLQQMILDRKMTTLTFYKDRSEYFVNVSEILFFETDGEKIYGHTREDAYEVRQKLYELRRNLPAHFLQDFQVNNRQCQADLFNRKIFLGNQHSELYQTHKQVHVSRHYYQLLKERLKEMR